jgi:hypothetical protein
MARNISLVSKCEIKALALLVKTVRTRMIQRSLLNQRRNRKTGEVKEGNPTESQRLHRMPLLQQKVAKADAKATVEETQSRLIATTKRGLAGFSTLKEGATKAHLVSTITRSLAELVIEVSRLAAEENEEIEKETKVKAVMEMVKDQALAQAGLVPL